MYRNMFLLCGEAAYNFGYKIVRNLVAYTHNPLKNFSFIFLKSYTHFYTRLYNLAYTHKCAQFISVNSRFYTLYTGPTITTTLNN
jgi:hypothetical protein